MQRRVHGRSHYCRLRPAPLAAANKWLKFYERYWDDRLTRLQKHFAKPHEDER